MSNNKFSKLLAGAAIIFSTIIFTDTSISAEQQTKASPEVPPKFKIGKLLYGKFCSSCHGVDLKGTEQGPPFLHRFYHPGHHGDASFFRAAKHGVKAHHWKFGNMPPVEGVDDDIISAIIQYIRHIQKSEGLF